MRVRCYKKFRAQLFLPNLRQVRAGSGLNPSVMFFQRDLLNAFFSWAFGGRGFALSATLIALSVPVALLKHLPPGLGRQARALANSSPRDLVTSPQSTISSQYTQVMLPQPRASSELSQGTEGHWSQFSFPAVDESNSEGEGTELQNQMERSVASVSDDCQSFRIEG
jgi:hypothetical protein